MRKIALLALLLTGCDSMPQAWSEAEIRAMAREEHRVANERLLARIKELEADIAATKQTAEIAGMQARLSDMEADGLRKTLNHNANVANSNTLKDMTAAGACGQRAIYRQENEPPSVPAVRFEKIPCTKADLKK